MTAIGHRSQEGITLEGKNDYVLNLTGACLNHLRLEEANLSSVRLGGADLGGAYLPHVNLSYAGLAEANLSGKTLAFADLSGSILRPVPLVAHHTLLPQQPLQQPVLLQLGGSRATEAVHQPVEVPGTLVFRGCYPD